MEKQTILSLLIEEDGQDDEQTHEYLFVTVSALQSCALTNKTRGRHSIAALIVICIVNDAARD